MLTFVGCDLRMLVHFVCAAGLLSLEVLIVN